MSVVIVGGNERMVCQYEDICKGFGCKAKVFAKEKGAMKKKIGVPDLMILFTSTVSHKMVNCAVEEAKKKSIPVCRCHTSSAAALENILKQSQNVQNSVVGSVKNASTLDCISLYIPGLMHFGR